jgi:RNA polymerase sigma-70 factor (ECF subfamily)
LATVDYVDIDPAGGAAAAAADALYRRHAARVHRYCQSFLRRPADAEDALQQTYLRAQRALSRGVEPVSEATWLLTIARNVCLTRLDAEQRRNRVEVVEDPQVLSARPGRSDERDGLSPELVAALAVLPERQRRALLLREWHELSYAEIATALDTTEAAVETLLFRARKSLAAALAGTKRRRLGLAGVGGWLRELAGVGVPKLVAGAFAVATVAATGSAVPRTASHGGTVAPARVQRLAPARAPAVPAIRRAAVPVVVHERRALPSARVAHRTPLVHSHAVPALPRERVGTQPAAPAPATSNPVQGAPPAQPTGPAPSAPSPPVTAPAPKTNEPAAPSSVVPPVPQPVDTPDTSVTPVIAPVVTTVTTATDAAVESTVQAASPVVDTVTQAVPAGAQPVQTATDAVQGTVAGLSGTVSSLLAPP